MNQFVWSVIFKLQMVCSDKQRRKGTHQDSVPLIYHRERELLDYPGFDSFNLVHSCDQFVRNHAASFNRGKRQNWTIPARVMALLSLAHLPLNSWLVWKLLSS